MGEQNRQNRQNKQNRTAYKSGGTRVRARRRRFKERSDRATPPGARAATAPIPDYFGACICNAKNNTHIFSFFPNITDDSAKAILRAITHKGDALKADEEGDRFDAGIEGTWATRKHRSFLIHAVAAAAARALFSALASESRNRRARHLLPSAKPGPNFAAIHSPRFRKRRNDFMRNTLSPAP